MKRIGKVLGLFSLFILLLSCEARQELTLEEDLSGEIRYSVDTAPFLNAYFGDVLMAMTGLIMEDDYPLFDPELIEEGLLGLPGIRDLEYSEDSTGQLQVSFSFDSLPDLIAAQEKDFPLQIKKTSQGQEIRFNLNKGNSSSVLQLLSFPQEGTEYLLPQEGEDVSPEEYLELLLFLFEEYGDRDNIERYLKTAEVTIVINCPARIKSINGGVARGHQGEISIPLLDLLTLQKPIEFTLVF